MSNYFVCWYENNYFHNFQYSENSVKLCNFNSVDVLLADDGSGKQMLIKFSTESTT
jgi:hypothetical protein